MQARIGLDTLGYSSYPSNVNSCILLFLLVLIAIWAGRKTLVHLKLRYFLNLKSTTKIVVYRYTTYKKSGRNVWCCGAP